MLTANYIASSLGPISFPFLPPSPPPPSVCPLICCRSFSFRFMLFPPCWLYAQTPRLAATTRYRPLFSIFWGLGFVKLKRIRKVYLFNRMVRLAQRQTIEFNVVVTSGGLIIDMMSVLLTMNVPRLLDWFSTEQLEDILRRLTFKTSSHLDLATGTAHYSCAINCKRTSDRSRCGACSIWLAIS